MTYDDDDTDVAEVRQMAAAKGLEMREIDFFDGEFEEQSYLVVAPWPVWDSRVVAIGTARSIREYLDSDWCEDDMAMLANPNFLFDAARGIGPDLKRTRGLVTSMVRLNQVSKDDGVPPTINLVMDCDDRVRVNISLTADQAVWIRDRLTKRLHEAMVGVADEDDGDGDDQD